MSPLIALDEFKELIGLRVYPKMVIDDVKIEGGSHLSDYDRAQLIAALERRQFDRDDDWLADPEGIVSGYWRDRGYFRVNVTTEEKVLSSDSTYQHVALSFHVQEGLQYRLQVIRFQNTDRAVPLAFPPGQLRKLIPLQDGELFNTESIRKGMEALMNLYTSRGYIDFVTVPDTQFDEISCQIALVMGLDQGRQFRIAKMEVVGTHLEAQRILRSRLKVGDIFNSTAIKDFFRQNKPLLPPDTSLQDVHVTRNIKNGTVSLVFDFRDCPR